MGIKLKKIIKTMPKLKPENGEAIIKKLLDFIELSNGATCKEISKHMGFTTNNVYRYVNPLIETRILFKGVIRTPGVTKDNVEMKGYFIEP